MQKQLSTVKHHIQSGDLGTAESICQDILKKNPNQIDALYLLATLAFRQNKLQAAINIINTAISAHPASANFYLLLGDVFTKLGRLNDAEKNYHTSIKLNPESAETHNNLGIIYKEQGKFDNAKNSFEKAISINPKRCEFLNNRAVIALNENSLDEAENLLEKAVNINSNYTDAYSNLGKVLANKGELDKAKKYFEKTIQLNPNLIDPYYQIARIYSKSNNFDDAIKYYKKCLKLKHDHYYALFHLTIAYFESKKFNEALNEINKANKYHPNNAAIYFWLGLIHLKLNLNDEAIVSFEKSIKLDNSSEDTYYNLAFAFSAKNLYQNSINCLKRAIELKPDFHQAHTELAVSLFQLKKYSESEKAFYRATEINPKNPTHYIYLGNIYRCKGDLESARKFYKKSLSLDSNLAEAHRLLAKAKTDKKDALSHAEEINNILKDSHCSNSERMKLSFSLGDIYDTNKLYKRAFKHYTEANKLAFNDIQYDSDQKDISADRILSIFDDNFFSKRVSFGNSSTVPIFIVGMPRSGTTLVEQILSSHPSVHAAGEITDIDTLKETLPGKYPQIITSIDEPTVRSISDKYLTNIRKLDPASKYVTNKLPNNFINLGWIHLLFPKSKIIHCQRDPLDTCISIYFQYFTQRNDYAYSLETIGRFYNLYKRMMKHWNKSSYLRRLDISYEELVNNQEKISKDIINYVGLEWDEKCLQFYKNDNYVSTCSVDQVRKPIYAESVGRWKNYEEYLSPLLKTLNYNQE